MCLVTASYQVKDWIGARFPKASRLIRAKQISVVIGIITGIVLLCTELVTVEDVPEMRYSFKFLFMGLLLPPVLFDS